MLSRDFRGLPALQEVECWGEGLKTEVELISLKLVKLPESTELASLNVFKRTCMTHDEYASCEIDSRETHRSRVRVLVHDLEEGQSREYGCTASIVAPNGDVSVQNWKISVKRRQSKF